MRCKLNIVLCLLDLEKKDLEGKLIIHHVLMNANDQILQYIIQTF